MHGRRVNLSSVTSLPLIFLVDNDAGNSTAAWLSLEYFKRVLVTKNPVSPNTGHN